MSVRKLGSWAIGAGTAALVLAGVSVPARAASPQSTFTAHYTQNANTEAQLLQQAQAEGGSSTTITLYSNTARSIGGQVAVLYSAEQALAATKLGIPSQTSARPALQTRQRTLTRDLATARAKLAKARKGRSAGTVRVLELQIKTWMAELNEVAYELAHPLLDGTWTGHPLGGGLTSLQQSVLDLQQAEIHYTRLWITAAKSAPTIGNPATISGLSYAASTITIPAAGYAAATDYVTGRPVVKDAHGNVLIDAGSYTVTGPLGSIGVSINPTTGQLFVNPGATAGVYVVTYMQGGIADRVGITVSH